MTVPDQPRLVIIRDTEAVIVKGHAHFPLSGHASDIMARIQQRRAAPE